MKNILRENMRRFGTKNLNEQDPDAEYDEAQAALKTQLHKSDIEVDLANMLDNTWAQGIWRGAAKVSAVVYSPKNGGAIEDIDTGAHIAIAPENLTADELATWMGNNLNRRFWKNWRKKHPITGLS